MSSWQTQSGGSSSNELNTLAAGSPAASFPLSPRPPRRQGEGIAQFECGRGMVAPLLDSPQRQPGLISSPGSRDRSFCPVWSGRASRLRPPHITATCGIAASSALLSRERYVHEAPGMHRVSRIALIVPACDLVAVADCSQRIPECRLAANRASRPMRRWREGSVE